jgi:hypothetical protein
VSDGGRDEGLLFFLLNFRNFVRAQKVPTCSSIFCHQRQAKSRVQLQRL